MTEAQDAPQESNTAASPAEEAVEQQKDYGFESTSQETIESLGLAKPWVDQYPDVAQPEVVDESPEKPAEDKDKEGKKSRYQRRIDSLVSEREDVRIELERIKKENETLKSTAAEKKEVPLHEQPVKTQSDFDTYEEYLDYVEEFEASQPADPVKKEYDDTNIKDKPVEKAEESKDAQAKITLSTDQQKALARLNEAFGLAEDKPADFDVVIRGDVSISGPMLEALAECDNPEKVAYHLGKNPELATDIASRSVAQQMRSIAKLEIELSKPSRPSQKITSAPDPISPVGVSDAGVKPLSKITEYSEYEARRKEQQRNDSYNGGW